MSEEVREVWSELESKRFLRRFKAMVQAEIDEVEAAQTAQKLLLRDRPDSGDDRRVCMECAHLDGRKCKAAGRGHMAHVKAGMEPVRTILQRCDEFALRTK